MKNKEINIQIGNNLRAERNRRNLSQEELAEMAKLQRQHISKIENKQIDVRISTLIPILKALDIKFEQLFDVSDL